MTTAGGSWEKEEGKDWLTAIEINHRGRLTHHNHAQVTVQRTENKFESFTGEIFVDVRHWDFQWNVYQIINGPLPSQHFMRCSSSFLELSLFSKRLPATHVIRMAFEKRQNVIVTMRATEKGSCLLPSQRLSSPETISPSCRYFYRRLNMEFGSRQCQDKFSPRNIDKWPCEGGKRSILSHWHEGFKPFSSNSSAKYFALLSAFVRDCSWISTKEQMFTKLLNSSDCRSR